MNESIISELHVLAIVILLPINSFKTATSYLSYSFFYLTVYLHWLRENASSHFSIKQI